MITSKNFEVIKGLETPFYFYNMELLEDTLDKCQKEAGEHGYHVHYALKANSNDKILDLISSKGFGADCVSGNEIEKALSFGFKGSDIAFAGVGKSDKEIEIGLRNEIFTFNVESLAEMEVINELAKKNGKTARIALRLNPNVNAKTHEYITTGLEENKFGINTWELESVLERLEQMNNLELKGLHFHIGSQITELSVYKGLCIRINEIQKWFMDRQIITEHVNVGGGLGIDYENPDDALIPDFKTFFNVFRDHLELHPNQHLHFELGRSLTAQSGNLVTQVLYIKEGINVNFAIVDAGMNDLIRPALYQSYHKIEKLNGNQYEEEINKYDVVGPICESSDCFGKSVMMPVLKRGDLVVLRSTGAYGEVMTSSYNLRDKAKSYYGKSDKLI